jgi:hypothetical protein
MKVDKAQAEMGAQVSKTTLEVIEALRKQHVSYQSIIDIMEKTKITAQEAGAVIVKQQDDEVAAIDRQVEARNRLRRAVGLSATSTGRRGGSKAEEEGHGLERGLAAGLGGRARSVVGYAGSGIAGAALGFISTEGIKAALSSTKQLTEETQQLTAITGLDQKQAASWIAVAQSRGVSAEQLTTAMRDLGVASSKSMGTIDSSSKAALSKLGGRVKSALDGTKSAQQDFARLGITYQQLKKGAQNLPSLEGVVQSRVSRLPTGSTAAVTISSDLLDKSTSSTLTASKAYQELGISQKTVQADAHNTGALFDTVSDKLDKMRAGTEKTTIESTLFGRSYSSLSEILAGGSKEFDGAAKKAQSYGLTMSGPAAAATAKLQKQQENLSLQTQGLEFQFSEQMAPTLLKFASGALTTGAALMKYIIPALKGAASAAHDTIDFFKQNRTALHALLIGAGAVTGLILLSKTLRGIGSAVRGAKSDWVVIQEALKGLRTPLASVNKLFTEQPSESEKAADAMKLQTTQIEAQTAALNKLIDQYGRLDAVEGASGAEGAVAGAEGDAAALGGGPPRLRLSGESAAAKTASNLEAGTAGVMGDATDADTLARSTQTAASSDGLLGALFGAEGAASMGTTLLSGGMAAGVGGLLGNMGGGAVGGLFGQQGKSWGKAIGTGAGIGAGIGSVVPVLGTGVGAAVGAGVGAAAKGIESLLNQPSAQDKQVAGLQNQIKQAASSGNVAALQKLSKQADDVASHFTKMGQTTTTVMGRFGAVTEKGPDFSKQIGQLQAMSSAASKAAGDLQGADVSKFTQQLSQIQLPDAKGMVTDWVAQFNNSAPSLRDAAGQAMLQLSAGLEAKGKLPAGAVSSMIASMEKQFPGLHNYLRKQGEDTASDLASSFRLQSAQKNLGTAVGNLETEFPSIRVIAKKTGGGMVSDLSAAMSQLKDVMSDGTAKQKQIASTQYGQLQTLTQNYFQQMTTAVTSQQQSQTKAIQSGSLSAMQDANQNWSQYAANVSKAMSSGVISVQQGNKLLTQELNATLKAFGSTKLIGQPTVATGGGQNKATIRGIAKNFGGWVPGDPYSDSTPILAAGNEFVMTGHGQQMMEHAAPGLLGAIASQQMPHFADGGFVDRIKAPVIEASGTIVREGQAALNTETKAANRMIAQLEGMRNGKAGASILGVSVKGPVSDQIAQSLHAGGWDKVAIAGAIGNAVQESSLHPAISGGGAAGLWQWTPGSKLFSYAQQHHVPWQAIPTQASLLTADIGRVGVSEMNSQRTPSAAALWLMNNFEKPGIPAAANRVAGAEAAFAQGYRGGGFIRRFQNGGALGDAITGVKQAQQSYTHHDKTSSSSASSKPTGLEGPVLIPGSTSTYEMYWGPGYQGAKSYTFNGRTYPVVSYQAYKAQEANYEAGKTSKTKHDEAARKAKTKRQEARRSISGLTWLSVGAAIDQHGLAAQAGGAANYHAGMSFSEYLEAGANKGLRPDLSGVLGVSATQTGMRYGSDLYFRKPGGGTHYAEGYKSDIGSGVKGNKSVKVGLHPALARAIGYSAGAVQVASKSGGSGERTVSHQVPRGPGISGDAFQQAMDYAIAGSGLSTGQLLREAIQGAQLETVTKTISENARSGGVGVGVRGSTPAASKLGALRASMYREANRINGLPYVKAGGSADGRPPNAASRALDCSATVSDLINVGGRGVLPPVASPWTTSQTATYGVPGDGKYITVGTRPAGYQGQAAHTMMHFFQKYMESSYPGKGPHFDSNWSESFPIRRHPAGFRGGGFVAAGTRMANGQTQWDTGSWGKGQPGYREPSSPKLRAMGYRTGGPVRRTSGTGLLSGNRYLTGLPKQQRSQFAITPANFQMPTSTSGTQSLAAVVQSMETTIVTLGINATRQAVAQTTEQVQTALKGLAAGGKNRNIAKAMTSLSAALNSAGTISYGRLLATRQQIQSEITLLQKGKESASDKQEVDRLQQALKLTSAAMGARVGAIVMAAQNETQAVQNGQTALTNLMNRKDISAESAKGTKMLEGYADASVKTMRDVVSKLETAYKAAVKAGDKSSAKELKGQLQTAMQGLDTALGNAAQARVTALETAAQQAADTATHGATMAAGATSMLQTQLQGTAALGGRTTADQTVAGGQALAASYQQQAGAIQGQIAALTSQEATAQKVGDQPLAQQIAESIQSAQGDYQQALLSATEAIKAGVEGQAQALTDMAQHGVNMASGATSNLQQQLQGLGGAQDLTQTVAGGQQLAASYQNQASQQAGLISALQSQQQAALSVGDQTLADQIAESIQGAQGTYQQDSLEALQAIRTGVEGQAQTALDAATHASTMAATGEQTIQLQQQLANTQNTPGAEAQYADYINQTVIPALQAQLVALQNQQKAAESVGDTDLATQIAEAIGGQQNDILSAQLDAQQAIQANTQSTAENTSALSGQLGVSFESDTYTDLAGLLNGT